MPLLPWPWPGPALPCPTLSCHNAWFHFPGPASDPALPCPVLSSHNASLYVMQALGDAERQAYMKGKRILEVNPRHPLIQQVKAKFESDPDNASTAALAKILYETALLESGFQVCFD